MSDRFPDVLLPDVLEYLELETILLSAMPVSRFWREQACAHPTYWRELKYTGREDYVEVCGTQQYDNEVPKHQRSLDLFLLRLSRTYSRPVDIVVLYPHPLALDAIAPHLTHLRRLDVAVLVRHWQTTMDVLRGSPAPLMESLSLSFHYHPTRDSDRQYYTVLPRDLLAGHLAPLKEVRLSDVGMLSLANIPACFAGITSLVVVNTHPSVPRALPNVFQHCRQLRKLWIYYRVTLEDPEFRNVDTWRGLTELSLNVLENWGVLALPLATIPCIIMAPWSAQHVLEIVPRLGSRLTLEVPPLQPGFERSSYPHFYTMFGAVGDTTSRERLMKMRFPSHQSERPERLALTALRDAVVGDRIIDLTLAAHNWDLFVGKRYLSAFPALNRLSIMMTDAVDATSLAHSAGATLSCPRLARLVLKTYPGLGAVTQTLATADLCAFAREALPDAPYPIALELVNVSLSGSLSGLEDLFEC